MPHFQKFTFGLILLTLALVLGACGGPGAAAPRDDSAPAVAITSPGVSVSSEYQLTGTVWAATDIDSASYSLNGSEASLSITAGEFSTLVSLQPGLNDITVTVTDAAGNAGSASRSVRFGEDELVLSSDTAMHGESIELGGTFGPGGSVNIGGVPATVANWSAATISVEVPSTAPSGWTDVTVTSNSGVASARLFVGTSFEPGSLDELNALGLPAGTAVRLAAGTYTVAAPPLAIDGLSLYGQGSDQTIINTGTSADALRFTVSGGHDFALHDLTLITDGTYITPGDLSVTAASGPFDPLGFTNAFDLARALAERSDGQLAALASRPNVTLQNLNIEHNLGASLINFGVTDVFTGVTFHGNVAIDNVSVDTAGITYVATSGHVTMTDSAVKAGGTALMALGGDVRVERSRFDLSGVDMAGGLMAQNRLLLDDVTYISRGSNPSFGSLSAQSGLFPATHASSVTNSAFHSFEPDPSATGLDATGSMDIFLGGGPTYFTDNVITSHRHTYITLANGSILFEDNTFNIGDSGIPEANVEVRQKDVPIPDHLFRTNTFTWTVNGGLHLAGYYGSLAFSDNTFVGAETGTAVTLVHNSGDPSTAWNVDLSNNTFRDFTGAFSLSQSTTSPPSLQMLINGNVFDFEFTAAPQVAELTQVISADIDASGNQWGSLTTAAAARAFVSEVAPTPSGTFVINNVLIP